MPFGQPARGENSGRPGSEPRPKREQVNTYARSQRKPLKKKKVGNVNRFPPFFANQPMPSYIGTLIDPV